MNLIEMKRLVTLMKERAVGDIYVGGERCYVWVKGRGWVNPGPFKKKMRPKARK